MRVLCKAYSPSGSVITSLRREPEPRVEIETQRTTMQYAGDRSDFALTSERYSGTAIHWGRWSAPASFGRQLPTDIDLANPITGRNFRRRRVCVLKASRSRAEPVATERPGWRRRPRLDTVSAVRRGWGRRSGAHGFGACLSVSWLVTRQPQSHLHRRRRASLVLAGCSDIDPAGILVGYRLPPDRDARARGCPPIPSTAAPPYASCEQCRAVDLHPAVCEHPQ